MAAAASASKTASPLEHILQTLFGKKKAFDPAATEPVDPTPAARPEARAEGGLPAVPLLDPIVQQFGQLSRERALEEEEDDRPYDPEEEYGPDRALDAQLGGRGKRPGAERASETTEREEVAYDPEDETILEEAKVTVEDLPNRMCADTRGGGAAAPSLAEQQQMIEELNRQIEEQKRQVQEQEEALRQQRAAVGASMAHFSVSDALMSPPPKAVLPKAELFLQEPPAASGTAGPPGGQGPGPSSDPRQNRDPRQARRLAAESSESESSKAPASSTPGALPSRDVPGGAAVGQGPVPTPEEKEPSPPAWAPRDEASRPAKQEGPLGEPSESRGPPPPANGGPPMAGGPGPARPARKVLLPTPPSAAFPPGFPAQSEGQGFGSPAARDPFVSPAFTSQDRAFGSSLYEDPRNAPFAEKCNRSATETEGDRDTQGRPGEGAATCPPPGQATCPPPGPQCQAQREPAPRSFGMSGLHGPNFPGPRGPMPPFSEENVISNNDGLRGPPPARFGAQKGPIPSLFSGPHGPPPYGDARGPSPSHPVGPRAAAPPPFEERKDPHGGPRELQDAPYGDVAGTPGPFEGLEQGPSGGSRGPGPFPFGGPRRPLLAPFKGPRGGPPPSQFGGQRGPPPGHFVGPRGPHPSQFDGPRGQAANFMPGPRGLQPQQFDEQRVNSPPRFANQRAPAPLQFGGPRGPIPFPDKSEPAPPRFHFQGPGPQGVKPVPRPLLELPSHPPQHRKDRWDEVGPAPTLPSGTPGSGPEAEAQWAPPDFREGKAPEYRNQAGPKEKPPEEPETQAESRQSRAFEDRRRERERGRNWSRERDWDRGREWDRHREKDSCRDRNRDRERDWERGRERSRNRDRRLRDRERSRSRDRDRDRARERERGRDRRDRSKSKEDVRDPKAETSVP